MKNKKKTKQIKKTDELQQYIDQLTGDNKPIYTFGDIDQKFKSGAFTRTVANRLPLWLRVALATMIIGSILYGLVRNIVLLFNF